MYLQQSKGNSSTSSSVFDILMVLYISLDRCYGFMSNSLVICFRLSFANFDSLKGLNIFCMNESSLTY